MNRYAPWRYVVIAAALTFGFLYTLPNFFPPAPAVQVASEKATIKIDDALSAHVTELLKAASITPVSVSLEGGLAPSLRIRLADEDTQRRAKAALETGLNPDPKDPTYVVALNLVSSSPAWLTAIHALPMYLGLDLRGGVHFLLQVDMNGAVNKRVETMVADARQILRDKTIRASNLARVDQTIVLTLTDLDTANKALAALKDGLPDLSLRVEPDGSNFKIVGSLLPTSLKQIQDSAIKQNMTTLRNRVNQLGTSEPVIQQQGVDRIVVELPGVQDTARAKEIIGRTATLEARMVDSSPEAQAALATGIAPALDDRFVEPNGAPIFVKKQIIFSGENLSGAQAGNDTQTQEPVVNLTLDSKGGRVVRDVSRDNIGQRMALILFEKGRGEVITAPYIRGELGNRFQISGGGMTPVQAADTALLLRSGSLAASMDFIEERSVGPSLGRDNIQRGFYSTIYGFCAIAIFMMIYYVLFGLVSVIALGSNLLLLVALLSLIQATLTLPGIAAIALTLGMAIDSNVLINERIREELRNGTTPQAAIAEGYSRALGTILDSNITTLIAGLSLLAFGSGPVRGFAVVHCLGIATSIFSSVFVSRGIVNLIYGRRKRLTSLAIGQIWKPA